MIEVDPMAVKSRFTVVFQEAEDVGEHLKISDDELAVKGGPDVVYQQRWVLDLSNRSDDGSRRISWRSGHVEGSDLSRVVSAILSPGFNVYSSDAGRLHRGVETPLYQSYHGAVPEFSKYVPIELEKALSRLDPGRCDIDIRLTEERAEIGQWCLLPEGETVVFRKEPDVDACEAGLFYLDTRDSTDVNISGLRCTWGTSGEMQKCQKTTLFYKTAHTAESSNDKPSIELETPVGLHPKILVDLRNSTGGGKCGYFVYLQLPVDLFIDKFQSTPLFLYGEQDLELPEYKLRDDAWGSEALFELTAGEVNEITLHSRYVEPIAGNDSKTIEFTPQLLRACDTDDEDIRENPFYSRGLGYESFFTPNTRFEAFSTPILRVPIPRPDTAHYETTKFTTLICLLISLAYILTKLMVKPRSRRHNTK